MGTVSQPGCKIQVGVCFYVYVSYCV